MTECLNGTAYADLQMDVGSGRLLSVKGTPTLFVGIAQSDGRVKLKERLDGNLTATELGERLNVWLKEANFRID